MPCRSIESEAVFGLSTLKLTPPFLGKITSLPFFLKSSSGTRKFMPFDSIIASFLEMLKTVPFIFSYFTLSPIFRLSRSVFLGLTMAAFFSFATFSALCLSFISLKFITTFAAFIASKYSFSRREIVAFSLISFFSFSSFCSSSKRSSRSSFAVTSFIPSSSLVCKFSVFVMISFKFSLSSP